MAYSDAIEKIETEFDSRITSISDVLYQNEGNDTFTKPTDDIWARLTVECGEAVTRAVSNKTEYRFPVVMTIQIFVPIGTETSDADSAINEIIEDFCYEDISVGDAEGTVVVFDRPQIVTVGWREGVYQKNLVIYGRISFFK
jgi:hypothetical protein